MSAVATYRPWSPGEDVRLRELLAGGLTHAAVAQALGRTTLSVRNRRKALGLTQRRQPAWSEQELNQLRNLASRDTALERVLRLPRWEYLRPLLGLRPLWAELTMARNRLRKDGTETRADGSLVANPQRLGPLTLEARRYGLETVCRIQGEVNAGAGEGQPFVSLIDHWERERILELIAANTWPQKWDGTEMRGDEELLVRCLRGGGRQLQMVGAEGRPCD